MERRVAAWTAGVVLLAGLLHAGAPLSSYREARAVLDAGVQAMGGIEALREIKDVTREATGTAYAQGQSLQPEQPLVTRAIELHTFQDFAGNKSATLFSLTGTGVLPTRTRTVAADDAFTYNLVTKVKTPLAPAALAAARANLRRDPAVLLLSALDRSETLRSLGEDTLDGKKHKLVTFSTAEGAQLALAFDPATGLLARVQTLAEKQGLAVEAILPGHGRAGTLADLTAALAVKMPN